MTIHSQSVQEGQRHICCRQALLSARPSTNGRQEFGRADLVEWGLAVAMGTAFQLQVSLTSRLVMPTACATNLYLVSVWMCAITCIVDMAMVHTCQQAH